MLRTAEDLDQIAQLDQKNATLLARRAELLEELAAIDRDIARVAIEKAEFSPLYHIPEDVLKIILEEACAHSHTPTLLSCSDHLSPLTATHICRRWRRTSIALPTIWTCIRPSSHIAITRATSVPLWQVCSIMLMFGRIDVDYTGTCILQHNYDGEFSLMLTY